VQQAPPQDNFHFKTSGFNKDCGGGGGGGGVCVCACACVCFISS